MEFLLKPIFTRTFLFLYLLGITSSIVTVPDYKGAHMYENAPLELFIDIYVVSLLLTFIPEFVNIKRWKMRLRTMVKALVYVFTYSLYIIDTFCFVKFGSTLNASMLLLMGETNSNEASEFFHSYLTTDILLSEVGIIILIPLLHFITAVAYKSYSYKKQKRTVNRSSYSPRRKANSFIHRSYGTRIVVLLLLNIAVIGMLGWCGYTSYDNKAMFIKVMSKETVGDIEHEMASQPHVTLYQPTYRLAFAIYCNHLASKQLDRLTSLIGNVEVDSCSVKSPNIVLIIGESCNLRHSQLYGYDKPNTPNQKRLEDEGMLVKMKDAVAPWNLTSFVFKHLMTTYCVGDDADWCDYPLFCELFRKAGYTVSFFTNQFLPQAKEAVYDFSGGFFINNPELSEAQFDVRNSGLHIFDEGLLKDYEATEIPNRIESGNPTLTIFHLMGQHVNYRVRCPKNKKKWTKDDYPNDSDMPDKRKQIMADYDNAVWYNDSVTNQIIERFKDKDAIVIYLSDHGEEVFGPGVRHFFGRMHKAEVNKRLADEEFRIPMWFYCSPLYKEKHPDIVSAIEQVKNKPYMTDALSHMLLGLAGIKCKYYHSQYDLLSPKYDEHRKRLLKHTYDYDTLE